MTLDFALGLNALICFAALWFPVFGFIKGRRGQVELLKRAQYILLSLLALLVANILMLQGMAIQDQVAELAELRRYAVWAGGGLIVGSALGWILFGVAQKRAGRK